MSNDEILKKAEETKRLLLLQRGTLKYKLTELEKKLKEVDTVIEGNKNDCNTW